MIVILINKEVEIKWNPQNKKRLVELGYIFTKMNDIVKVKVEHLTKGSNIDVEVQCDYCYEQGITKIINKAYYNYNKERQKIEKDACDNCKQEKYKDFINLKQQEGSLSRDDKGYYNFKENRLKDLKLYIDKYGTIDKMEDNKEGITLYNAILNNNESPYSLVKELGYNPIEICSKRPSGYYSDFDMLKRDLEVLINKFGRFPTKEEICLELKTGTKTITRHGGMYELKRKMNYNDKYDLVDNSGFFNKSVYELIVANFLLENKIPYMREQLISDRHKYRSDFTFILKNQEKIQVEVWGYRKNNKTKISLDYNIVRCDKEKLYKEQNIRYISIEPEVFYKKNYKQIEKSLIEIFSILKEYEFTSVDKSVFIPSYEYTDEEILYILKRHSEDNYLPNTDIFKTLNKGLHNQILKRHGSYYNFAIKFGMKVKFKPNNYWNDNQVFNVFDHMIDNYDKILSRSEITKINHEDIILNDFSKVISSLRIRDLKLKYYRNRIQITDFKIPDNDLTWLKQVKKNYSRRGNIPYTSEQQNIAIEILYNLNKAS